MKDVDAYYYGYLDDEDGLLMELEREVEKKGIHDPVLYHIFVCRPYTAVGGRENKSFSLIPPLLSRTRTPDTNCTLASARALAVEEWRLKKETGEIDKELEEQEKQEREEEEERERERIREVSFSDK